MKIDFGNIISIGPITKFDSPDLPALTVITGFNGSGKTQLLKLIAEGKIKVIDKGEEILPTEIQNGALGINYTSQPKGFYVSGGGKYLFQEIHSTGKDEFDWLYQYVILRERLPMATQKGNTGLLESSYKEEYVTYLEKAKIHFDPQIIGHMSHSEFEYHFFNATATEENIEAVTKAHEIAFFSEEKRNRFMAMADKLIFRLNPDDKLFTQHVGGIFNAYAHYRFWNSFYKTVHGDEFERYNILLTDREFLSKNPPPWVSLNLVFDKYNIDYSFDGLKIEDYMPNGEYPVMLRKKSTGDTVALEHLSTGEQMIIGLLLKAFLATYYNGQIKKPRLLLLDEPDAYLHPELTWVMMKTLEEIFVDLLKINVILVTHSATTVAIVPENSLFELSRKTRSLSLSEIRKDDALNKLTEFLPTLSIDYKNHRQVFVESPTDLNFFQSIYEQYARKSELQFKLYFISRSKGDGSSSQVFETVESLTSSGVNSIFGIVDWDESPTHKGNLDKGNVFVHGKQTHYSIESFLFNPIYLIAYFIQKGYNNIHNDLKIPSSFSADKIGEETQRTLQQWSNYFFEKFSIKNHDYRDQGELLKIQYFNKITLEVPKKYLMEHGHKRLIPMLNRAFPEIMPDKDDEKTNGALTDLIAGCFPFVPNETISILNRLAIPKASQTQTTALSR